MNKKFYKEDKTMPIWNIKSIYSAWAHEDKKTIYYNIAKIHYATVFVEWGAIILTYTGLFFVLKYNNKEQ